MVITLYGEDTDRALELLYALFACQYNVAERARKDIAQYGLGMSEFAMLDVLYHKGSMPLTRVASRMHLSGGSTTYITDRLEKRGLIRRRVCSEDGRRQYAELTMEGRQLFQEIFPKHADEIRKTFHALSPNEQEEITFLLQKLSASLSARVNLKDIGILSTQGDLNDKNCDNLS